MGVGATGSGTALGGTGAMGEGSGWAGGGGWAMIAFDYGPSQAKLEAVGATVEARDLGYHLVVKKAGRTFDLWPSSGAWRERGMPAEWTGLGALLDGLDRDKACPVRPERAPGLRRLGPRKVRRSDWFGPPSEGMRKLTQFAKRNPGATYEELSEVSGLKMSQVARVVVAWEAWGAVYRERQWDRKAGRWATCVRPVAK